MLCFCATSEPPSVSLAAGDLWVRCSVWEQEEKACGTIQAPEIWPNSLQCSGCSLEPLSPRCSSALSLSLSLLSLSLKPARTWASSVKSLCWARILPVSLQHSLSNLSSAQEQESKIYQSLCYNTQEPIYQLPHFNRSKCIRHFGIAQRFTAILIKIQKAWTPLISYSLYTWFSKWSVYSQQRWRPVLISELFSKPIA